MDLKISKDITKDKAHNIFPNIARKFMEIIQDRIKTNKLKENLQNQYAQILNEDETIEYNVFSKIAGKDYTILSFQDEKENIIKIQNLLLPKETNSRTVLNYKNGEFEIKQEKTEINNKNWENKQQSEEILKEGTENFLEEKKTQIEQYQRKSGQIYIVNQIEEDSIRITNITNQKEQIIKRDDDINIEKGDFIKTKEIGYEKYDGAISIENTQIKGYIKM